MLSPTAKHLLSPLTKLCSTGRDGSRGRGKSQWLMALSQQQVARGGETAGVTLLLVRSQDGLLDERVLKFQPVGCSVFLWALVKSSFYFPI